MSFILLGSDVYLKAQPLNGLSVPVKDLCYSTKCIASVHVL